MMYSVQSEFIY